MAETVRAWARAALTLGLVGVAGLGGLLALRALTAERIAGQEQAAARRALAVLLPEGLDNAPETDRIMLEAPRWLGMDAPLRVHRGRRDGETTAFVIEAVAPEGYNGDIRLLVGVDAAGRVIGTRVLEHRETPGLGDGIDGARSDWPRQLVGRTLGDPPADAWRVRRDGGDFDQLAGATITPRAVLAAVRRVLQLVQRHGAALADTPTGTTLRLDDGPDALPPPSDSALERPQ